MNTEYEDTRSALNDFKVTNWLKFVVVVVVLAVITSAFYLGWPHQRKAARGSAAHAAAIPAAKPATVSAARFDPPRGFPDSNGIAVGTADAVVSDGLAYSFDGSDTQGGSDDGDQGPTVHAMALGSGDDQWRRPIPELTFPLTGPSLPPLAVAAAPGGGQPAGGRFVYYAGIVLIKGTGTQVDQLKLEVGALDPRTGALVWVTQVRLSSSFLNTEESVIGDVEAGIMGANGKYLVVEVNGSDEAPVTFGFSARTHQLSWTASGFKPAGLAGDVVVGMTVADVFSDTGTPEGLSAQTGAVMWNDSSVVASVEGGSGGPAVVSPSIATFEAMSGFSDTTYLLDTKNGKARKTLSDSYTCLYDQVSVVACYSGGINGASLIGFDATSLRQLWELPDPAGTRVAPELHGAYKGLLYTAAGNGDVILNARTGVDEVVNVSIAPDLLVPDYGLVKDDSGGDDALLAYPATS
jgi:hypothetical protein